MASVHRFRKDNLFLLFILLSTITIINGATVLNDLLLKPSSNIMLTMDTPMSPIISSFATETFDDRNQHVSSMVSALHSASTMSQAPAMAVLKTFNVEAHPFWLTNQIFVKGATPPLIEALTSVSGVKIISQEQTFPLLPIFNMTTGDPPNGTVFWNVQKIMAHKVWKEGAKGKGVLIASIDTGVRASHNAIKDNYIGTKNHGWYDPILFFNEPNDVVGHGTHTVGTMVGKRGVGVAPKAKWMACRGCIFPSCLEHAVLACGQYVLCPSDPNGKHKNCTNVPDIVNNSWGGPSGATWFDAVINAWKAAGILPFFANGNNGPACETAGYPADNLDVMAIGATEKNDSLAPFSSRGPKMAMNGPDSGGGILGRFLSIFTKQKKATDIVKPDLSAPGKDVNSAFFLTDNSYRVMSGTSMASPLVAGAAALLLSKNPKLTMSKLKKLMYSTAYRKLPHNENSKCGDTEETDFPNNLYGHGRLNVYYAYKKMVQQMEQKQGKADDEKHHNSEDSDDGTSKEDVAPDDSVSNEK